jgi:hypothetical protein
MQSFIEYNHEHTFDWFFSVWDTVDAQNSWRNRWVKSNPLDVKIIEVMNPVRWEVETYDELKHNFKLRKFHPTLLPEQQRIWAEGILHSTPMMYKLHRVNLLRRTYEEENNFKYDVVIRYRANVLFKNPQFKLEYVKSNVLYNPGTGNPSSTGGFMLNDQFYYGSSDVMTTVCDVYNHLTELFAKYGNTGPEYIFYDWVVRENNIPIEKEIFNIYDY